VTDAFPILVDLKEEKSSLPKD
jgi:hypothetical protein